MYSYDNAGNILTKKTYALTAAGTTPSSPTSTNTYGYGNANWGDQLTSYNGTAITYDAIGNPLTYYNGSTYSFEWSGRRMTKATLPSTSVVAYTYNDDGIRTGKIYNGVEYTYTLNGSQIVSETWGSYQFIYLYDTDGTPIGMQCRRTSMVEDDFCAVWFEKNAQGDIVALYDDAGNKLISYVYDAWGNFTETRHVTSTASRFAQYNPFRYRGYYYDRESGFYYCGSRYYDPQVGRFINADGLVSTGQGLLGYNMYAYCGNNPVSRADSSGQFWEELLDALAQTFKEASGYFAVAAGVSQVDTIAPGPADVVSAAMLIGGALICVGVATHTALATSTHSVAIPKAIPKVDEKADEKEDILPPEPPNVGTTYYHVTTRENAEAIMASGVLSGGTWEGGYVYAWRSKPSKYAIKHSGAHYGGRYRLRRMLLLLMIQV